MTLVRFAAALAVAVLCVFRIDVALAQARAADDPNARSPLAPVFEKIDEAFGARLIGADDAASRWISGRLATFQPDVQSRDYAAALARDAKEPLYLASFADVCLRTPTPVECAERDVVGLWASRDADNAVPWLLQAERARRRNNVQSLVENLDRASRAKRYDTYDHRTGAIVWARLKPGLSAPEQAGGAMYAATFASGLAAALQSVETLCSSGSRAIDPRIAPACARLGQVMAAEASTMNDRRAGTQLALVFAANDAAKATAAELARTVVARQDRCREALLSLERPAAGGDAERARATNAAEAFIAARARDGEPAACDALNRPLR
ncbi:MAG TPA: hypothetical protein VNE58_06230 [Casimicrobiaceae bacterium]|nr:hypothetical protein [Casimicrobiaceae bacterium]